MRRSKTLDVNSFITNFESLKALLPASSDFFDFLTVLFYFIRTSPAGEYQYLSEYNKWFCSSQKTQKEIRLLFEHYFKLNDFSTSLSGWLEICKLHTCDLFSICIQTLICCDVFLNDWLKHQPTSGSYVEVGPLNTPNTQSLGYLFLTPPDGLQSDFILRNHLHSGRNLFAQHPEGLQSKLKNILFIGHKSDLAALPRCIRYDCVWPDSSLQKVSIATVPVSKYPWFQVLKNLEKGTFRIEYDSTMQDQLVNACLNILKRIESSGANIVIFPELALAPDALRKLRMYLARSFSTSSNIKLIFTGSNWDITQRKNIAYILSSQGRILSKIEKKSPFVLKENGGIDSFSEDLSGATPEILFVDIPRLGRILYSICKDSLAEERIQLAFSEMRSTLNIVSAYSSKIPEFLSNADSLATHYATISVHCNACASIPYAGDKALREQSYGFVSVPCVNNEYEDKQLMCHHYSRETLEPCISCESHCHCFDLYQIFPCTASGPKEVIDVHYTHVCI